MQAEVTTSQQRAPCPWIQSPLCLHVLHPGLHQVHHPPADLGLKTRRSQMMIEMLLMQPSTSSLVVSLRKRAVSLRVLLGIWKKFPAWPLPSKVHLAAPCSQVAAGPLQTLSFRAGSLGHSQGSQRVDDWLLWQTSGSLPVISSTVLRTQGVRSRREFIIFCWIQKIYWLPSAPRHLARAEVPPSASARHRLHCSPAPVTQRELRLAV